MSNAARPRRWRRWLFIAAMSLLGIVALFVVLFAIYRIPSGSMLPTLRVGTRVVVSRFHYSLFRGKPQVGDLIIYLYPQDTEKSFIKRVIGVGGDTIAVSSSGVMRNGKLLDRQRRSEPCSYEDVSEDGDRQTRPCVAHEERFEGRTWRVIQDVNSGPVRDSKPVTVPAGHVYVLGDNRDNSHDSRFWGTVPGELIHGKVICH